MLNIINDLRPFFEDCYRRINVREYARIMKISPPTASKTLEGFAKEGLLLMEKDRNYIFYYANKENKIFVDLSRIYWRYRLSELTNYLRKTLTSPTIVLFGSLSKAEAKIDSDVDLAVFSPKPDLKSLDFEKKLKRKIQIFWFSSFEDVDNKDLANNIANGFLLEGRLKWTG